MSFPPNQNAGSLNLTPQQYSTLINLLSQQPQASPTSPQFDPNYFSKLLGMQNQQMANSGQNTAMSQPQQPNPGNYQIVRIVDDPNKIGPQEVSMGLYNIFPSSDRKHIYVKTWNNDGLIDNDVYVLQRGEVGAPDKSVATDEMYMSLSKRVDDLEASLKRIQKQRLSKSKSTSSKTRSERTESMIGVNEEEIDNG